MQNKIGRRIFFISPGDLGLECRRISAIVAGINRDRGLDRASRLRLIKWQDTPAKNKSGKPDWETCFKDSDLVIMLLWKRWGEPSGRYSSEFKRALASAQRRAGAVWFYFRDLSDKILLNPDRQQKRILDLRDTIERDETAICFWYEMPEQWERMADDHLNWWMDGRRPERFKVDSLPHHRQRLAGWIEALKKAGAKKNRKAFRSALKAFDYAGQGRLTRACQMFARATDLCLEPYLVNEYGLFLKANHLLGKAEKQFVLMEQIGQIGRDMLLIGSASRHLGDIHEKRDDLETADEYYRKSLSIESNWDRKIKQAGLYEARGMIQLKTGNPESAEKLFLQALLQYQAANLIEGQAMIYYCLIGVYIEMTDKPRALEACDRALSFAAQMSEKRLIRMITKLRDQIEKI